MSRFINKILREAEDSSDDFFQSKHINKMNKFIYKILREAEDSSDDFFQSKHINKRKEDLRKELEKNKKEIERTKKTIIPKLRKGIEKIKEAYMSKDWEDNKEKLFLELFSRLHVDDKTYQSEYRAGYFLLDSNYIKRCFYDFKNNELLIDYRSIWELFDIRFDMKYDDIQLFMDDMLEEHFKLYDTKAYSSWEPAKCLLEEHFKLYK